MHYMEEMEVAGVCETCGQLIILRQTKDAQFITHNQHCEKPALSMWCDQPRKLGVITDIGE